MKYARKFDFGGFSGWRIRLSENRAIPTPAIHNGRVFVGGGFGSYDFYSVKAATGEVAWCRRTSDDGPTSAVVAGKFAFFNTESCTLEAVDIDTGDVGWSHWLGDPLLAQPATDGERVYMAYPKEGRHLLGAFGARSGVPLWTTQLGHDLITAPVVSGGVVYASTFDGCVWAIAAPTGELIWRRQMRATSAPWIVGDQVYVARRADASGGGREAPGRSSRGNTNRRGPMEQTARVDARMGEQTASYNLKAAEYFRSDWGLDAKARAYAADVAVAFSQTPASAKMHLTEGLIGENRISRAWRYQGSRPVVVDGLLFDTTGDQLEARDADTNELIWQWRNERSFSGERRMTPPAVTNGRVYIGTFDGRLLSFDAANGNTRWEVEAGAPLHWQPSVDGGRVFAGLEDGSLISFATGDNEDTGWTCWGGGPGHNGKRLRPQ